MEQGKVAIIGNVCCGLGSYLYTRTAVHCEEFFEPFHHVFRQGFAMDPAAWVRDNHVKAVVTGGSFKSPFSKDQWIRDQEEFLRGLVRLRVPILGICFGHELLASALGGGLEKQRRMRLKLDRITPVAEDPLFDGYDGDIMSPVSHSVRVVTLPPDFVLLARSEECEIMAMRHRDLPVYGVQFHPEMDVEIKEHDPTWNPMPDEDLAGNRGARVIRNFSNIAAAFHRQRIGV